MTNPVRRLRDAAGMSQAEFAQATGLSYSSIQQYEAGRRPSPEALEKLKAFAAKNHLPFDDPSAKNPIDFPTSKGKNKTADRLEIAHGLLQEIYRSGDEGTISAVHQNLETFARLVRLQQKDLKSRRKK